MGREDIFVGPPNLKGLFEAPPPLLPPKLLSRWLGPPLNVVSVMLVQLPCGCNLVLKSSVNRTQMRHPSFQAFNLTFQQHSPHHL